MIRLRLLLAAALVAAIPAAASAETRGGTLSGGRLELHAACVRTVAILPDPDLRGTVAYEATADDPAEFARFSTTEGYAARLDVGVKANCRHGDAVFLGGSFGGVVSGGSVVIANGASVVVNGTSVAVDGKDDGRDAAPYETTMRLTVRVPVGMPIRLGLTGHAVADVGAVRGPLRADVAGAASVKAAAVADVDADVSGKGALTVAEATGFARVFASGAGIVRLSGGRAPELIADASGAARIDVDAEVGDLHARADGAATINVSAVTGRVDRIPSDAGRIAVGKR